MREEVTGGLISKRMHGRSAAALLGCGLLAAALALAQPAQAEPTPQDRAAADALFNDAKTLLKKGKAVEACPKLEASQKLDPGIGTLLLLGLCFEDMGRTASAWTTFNEAESMARKAGDKRAAQAAEHAKRVEPNLAKLRIEVAGAGIEVTRDGTALGAALWNTPIPIDPGEHVIQARQTGKKPWSTKVQVPSGSGVVTVQVPTLEAALAVANVALASPTNMASPAPFWGAQRVAGAVVGTTGVVGLVIGAVFGGVTLSKTGAAEQHCVEVDAYRCHPEGIRLQRGANTTANVSNVAFAVGGAAVIAGIVLFVTAPKSTKAAGALRFNIGPAIGNAGLSLSGEW